MTYDTRSANNSNIYTACVSLDQQVGRDLQIPLQLDILQKEIKNLGAAIEKLTMRLSKVTTPAGPVGVTETPKPVSITPKPLCEYADNLYKKSAQISALAMTVSALESRLEL
jgi:hypothetical protein